MMSQQMGGMEQELAAYQALGPEGFQAHSNLGTNDERAALAAAESRANQDMVAKQLAAAEQFGQPSGRRYSTAGGAIGGGISDILKQVGGGIRTHQLQGQQSDLMKQGQAAQTGLLDAKDEARAASGKAQMEAIVQALAKRQQPQPMMGQQPGAGFGLQGPQFDPSLMGY
jgi:hypothetical protein